MNRRSAPDQRSLVGRQRANYTWTSLKVLAPKARETKTMSKTVSILACCVVTSIFSVATQAFAGSPVPARMARSEVVLVGGGCKNGYHRDLDGTHYCYAKAKSFGLPYVAPPDVGLPYVSPPNVGLPYAPPPNIGLPYVTPANVGLPYVGPPNVGLPYVNPPNVGLPYLGAPTVGLPYIEY